MIAHKVYETHPADSRVKEMGDTCQTVTSRWGTGGGNVPLVQSYGFEPGIAKMEGNPSRFSEEISPTLRAEMGDNQAAVAYALQGSMIGRQEHNGPQGDGINEEVSFTLNTIDRHAVAHTFKVRGGCEGGGKGYLGQDEKAFTISTTQDQQVFHNMAVRRLTPIECERLQGFPDNYTNIKENCPDGPRYKAMGNSMAVPVMRWIGERIQRINNER